LREGVELLTGGGLRVIEREHGCKEERSKGTKKEKASERESSARPST